MQNLRVPEQLRRHDATQATLDRFRGKEFSWSAGITCVHLARFHLRRMGHKVEPLPRFYSAIGASRALKERGWAGCADMLDAQPGLVRIPPMAMRMGDLAVLDSEDGVGGVMICAGPHKLFGWREDVPDLIVLDVDFSDLSGAWRV